VNMSRWCCILGRERGWTLFSPELYSVHMSTHTFLECVNTPIGHNMRQSQCPNSFIYAHKSACTLLMQREKNIWPM
jgi:hypothetical protein